ncbi:hypothetical protein NYE67_20550 [Solibacillus sp. FSL W8-0474]|uniref:hypothetical protein n=1 Tax=Solibacillus sp. FSL W8-0474 TaxID=2975336 RepID=UPI0030F8400F
MGMKQKLDKAYQDGFKDGQQQANKTLIQMARSEGIRQGSQFTWDIVEEMIPQLHGIGPRTQEKILRAVREFAENEKRRIEAGA